MYRPITTGLTEPLGPASPPRRAPTPQHAIWMPWTGRGRLATPEEEAVFVDELAWRSGDEPAAVRRSDVTAVLNALRCGLTVDELFDRAPGLHADRLYAAYCDLERRRAAAGVAWNEIAVAGRIDVFAEHRAEAAKLLPALVTRLDDIVVAEPDEFDLVLVQLAAAVASTGAAARRIERVIEASEPESRRAIELGRVLYHHGGEGVTGRPDFLAHRVGALVPPRVAALLGETVGPAETCSRARRR